MPDLLDCRKLGFFAAVLAVAADFTFPLATDASFAEPFPFAADLDFSPAEDFEIEDFEDFEAEDFEIGDFDAEDLAFASVCLEDFLSGLTAAGFFPESLIAHEALPKEGFNGKFA